MKNNLFKLIALIAVCASLMGTFSFVALADTYDDLEDIFVTRKEITEWKVDSPFGQYASPSITSVEVPIDDMINIMEDCLIDRIGVLANEAANDRHMLTVASYSEFKTKYKEDIYDMHKKFK